MTKGRLPVHTIRCRRCKKMYEYEGLPSNCCPQCEQELEEQFQTVRSTIKENPGITPLELANLTDVSLSTIMGFIKNGQLES